MTEEATGAIEKELAGVTEQIARLEKYKTALNAALQARLDLEGFSNTRPKIYSPQTVTLTALTEGEDSPNAQPNSLEMARVVLLNLNGEEKTPDEIHALVKKTYGIEPAKTLDQMLYKRAGKGRTFYKTSDGRFGLLALRATIEEVRTPTTAVA
jgi:hypothetical protein